MQLYCCIVVLQIHLRIAPELVIVVADNDSERIA